MNTVTTSKGTFIFLEVPDNAKTLGDICDSFDSQAAQLGIDLNKTNFICTTSTATEETAAMVVDSEEITFNGVSHGMCYCHYYYKDDVCEWYSGKVNPAVKSLKSLIKYELALEADNNYAILKVI